ncbi:GNAT family N-acetyltransferase [Paraflavitalea pollutisoli]|uniref:GNAT family N-acetyltransferase n=1 Tax=Paraflavitalea pollutisoli TaxID=3034143 RepID=UPI0023EBDCD6|nr:GNAT family N-acetyltransferase [Paraflavitalea sp. H1-2-19X]
MNSVEAKPVQIVVYTAEYRNAFRSLNQAWINRYFRLEAADNKALDDPEGYILDKGGFIFIALYNDQPVGACALIMISDEEYELAKMAVDDSVQGKGIGYLLGQACLDKARALGATKVMLLSNTVLKPAIHLYGKLGFVEVPLPATEYERADIKMEIVL